MSTKSGKIKIAVISVLCVALIASIGINIYQAYMGSYDGFESYLQNTNEIYAMESGILYNNLQFNDGEEIDIKYDFSNNDYTILKEKYNLESISGDGSEFDKAVRLMNEFSHRLMHKGDYDNHIEPTALNLLEYSLDNRKQGINCKAKAQILNEMCLSCGIYSRKVWIMPYSKYDGDCHVVNEIWDTELNKWIMLDITNNEYWVDENGTPLSIIEIRSLGANQEFCTPVISGENLDNLQQIKARHIGDFIYIMKNMVYTEYFDSYTVGESKNVYLLYPKNMETSYDSFISEKSLLKSPVQ